MNRATILYFLILALFGVFLIAVSVRLLCSLPGADGAVCTLAVAKPLRAASSR